VTARRRDWLGAVVAVACAAVFVRLGIWQVRRLQERRAHNASVAARRALPPVALGVSTAAAESLAGRRVVLHGVFDYGAERLWTGRSYDGTPGVAVLTPLRLGDGTGVFVDRGWVPSPDGVHIDRPSVREGDTATVEGLAFSAPRSRGDVDPARLRDSVSYPLLPVVVQQVPPVPAGVTVRLSARPPYRWPVTPLDDGPHLSYAIQWFSFAVITLVGTAVLLRKSAAEGSRATN
jgi:surfeit locus 1 family protein